MKIRMGKWPGVMIGLKADSAFRLDSFEILNEKDESLKAFPSGTNYSSDGDDSSCLLGKMFCL